MKNSVKKFLAVALVGGALFGATGAQAHDWDKGRDRGGRHEQKYDRHDHRGYDKKIVHVHKHKPQKFVYKNYHSRPKYVYHDRYYHQNPGRFVIGFNFN